MAQIEFIDTELRMPLMTLPVRSVLVSKGNSKIFISPGSQITESQYAKFKGVTDIVAPSFLHGAGVAKAKEHFKNAHLWKPAGNYKPEVPWDSELTQNHWKWNDTLPILEIQGMPHVREVVFYEKESKTLLLTDFAFNILEPKGFAAPLLTMMFGTYRKFGVSRLFLRYVKDRMAFEQSVRKIFDWDFDRIVVSHGQMVATQGKKILRDALLERGISI